MNGNKVHKVFILTFVLLVAACNQPAEVASQTGAVETKEKESLKQPVDYVWPWLDSSNSRWFYFNTATRPFGMVNLSPDTEIDGAWGSGYRYNTTNIKGFNHVHAWQLSGPSVMPIYSAESINKVSNDYYSDFSHDSELVQAGYHKVTLDRYNIDVELTATQRVGFHRYHYPENKDRKILFDLQGNFGPSTLELGNFELLSETTFQGYVINKPTIRRPRSTPVFFYGELDTSVSAIDQTEGEILLSLEQSEGAVMMKVAISYVDHAGAKNNLSQELSHWNFDQTVNDAKAEWNRWLSKIAVEGGTETQKKRFYTDLFHALQGRRTLSDVDGRYSDQTHASRRIGQIPLNAQGMPSFSHHNSDSFWGAQWTIQTLWPLVYPKTASDFSQSMLQMYHDGGLIPRGPSGGNYTYVMTGASSTPFFVSNYMKGIRDVNIEEAYKGLKKNHMVGGMMGHAGYEHDSATGGGLEFYIDSGYVPYPLPTVNDAFHQDGAGQTLEYAYQDWTLSQLAEALGKTDDASYFLNRSKNYQHLFDPQTGFIRPRNSQGEWKEDFDPYEYQNGFVESNSAQMTWYVPHDIEGLASLMGGREKAIERLNSAFEVASEHGFTSGKSHDAETNELNRRVPINYGNQPSIQTAFIFNQLGAPHLTQYWSREVVNAIYSEVDHSVGFNGDEDQGLMGSLSVLLKIGLFQLDGGTASEAIYQIGSPIFDRIVLSLDNQYYPGKQFIIETENNSSENRFIQSVTLNGTPLNRHYLTHQEIVSGGTLRLVLGDKPKLSGE